MSCLMQKSFWELIGKRIYGPNKVLPGNGAFQFNFLSLFVWRTLLNHKKQNFRRASDITPIKTKQVAMFIENEMKIFVFF